MAPAPDDLGSHALRTLRALFERQKRQGERAMAQLRPSEYGWAPDPGSNSVAVLVKHLAGNMRSRWTDPFGRDGESPDRDRDAEFVDDGEPPERVLARWEEGWSVLFAALDGFAPEDLARTLAIRGERRTVLEALVRQASHYAEHVGQIVYLAKHLRGDAWETLSIPRRPAPPATMGDATDDGS